jgi:hypothetical protein
MFLHNVQSLCLAFRWGGGDMTEKEFDAAACEALDAIESAKTRLEEAHASFVRMGTMCGGSDAALPFLAKLEHAIDAVKAIFVALEHGPTP